jgi:predicted glycoside hydrolase/deacetylase ChbG (UPF0249 family)
MTKLSLPSNAPATRADESVTRTRLIVNADDFGLHPAINQAIIHSHEIGIVTSASLMPLGGEPSFDQAVEMAQHLPTLDIGLHFCLVGLPGQPKNYAEFLPRYLAKKYPEIPVEAMVHRQLDLLEKVGIKPTHIDSHHHLHAIPDIMRAVCKAAVDRGIKAVRLPIDTPVPGTPFTRALSVKGISEYAKRSKAIVEEYGLWHPDHFIGLADSGHLTESKVLTILTLLAPGVTELVCHPGAHNGRLEQTLKFGYGWEAERAALISERVTYKLSSQDIALTDFAICAAEAASKQPATTTANGA